MPDATSVDEILGGRLRLRQFLAGHRVGADAILLAASAGPPVDRFADMGSGTGAVALALLARWPGARGDLVEIDPAQAELASENARLNDVADRARVVVCDIFDRAARKAAGFASGSVELVVTNPPFFEAGQVRASTDARKARAYIFAPNIENPLASWIDACLSLLAPGGRLQIIHRADAIASILAIFGHRLGAIAVRPVHPRAESPAIRVLIGGVKGSKAPLRLLPGLVLHEASGAFTPLAEALHRGEATL